MNNYSGKFVCGIRGVYRIDFSLLDDFPNPMSYVNIFLYKNREQMAEIMFETFNVKGLFIGVQATLALYAQVAGPRKGQGDIDNLHE